ncbi:MAG TPA: type VII secretion integral membrane protein EccD [Streptosporangiaceae bacterium]
MTQAVAPELYRVTVVSPRKRVDLALPAHMPFADLFPGIALYAGLDRAAVAEAPEGWALQRLGEPPFEPPATPAQAGLADGELLYLRPWRHALPPVVSDDIADEIAGVHDGPGRWSPADGRRVALAAAAAALAAGAVILLRSGPPWTGPALAAGLLAVLLLAAGAATSRAAGDAGAGAVLGYTALPFAFAAGVLAPLRAHPLSHVSAVAVLAGFVLLTVAALIAAIAVAHGLAVFAGVAVAGGFGAVAAALAWLWPGLTAAGAAGLVVAPALALTPLFPAVAFRLARLPLPPVPATADDLRDEPPSGSGRYQDGDTQPIDLPVRARSADQVVTGMVSGLGLLSGGAAVVLGLSHGGLAPVLTAALACALLLRARLFRGRAQRLWLMIPGYGALIWLAVTLAGASSAGAARPAAAPVLLALVAAAALVAGTGVWLPGHRPSPFWSRAADVTDTLLIISLVPLALGVAGIFGLLHGLGG